MALRGFDCLLVWGNNSHFDSGQANIRYLTHISIYGLLIFPLEGEPVLYCTLPHLFPGLKAAQRWFTNLRPHPTPQSVAKELESRGFRRGKIGVVGYGALRGRWVPETIHHSVQVGIERMLPEATFEDASLILEEMRVIKSEEELKFLERAAEISYHMFEAMKDEARPGKRECDVVAAMLDAQIRNGGESTTFVFLDSGNPPLLGLGGRWPQTQSRRVLERGDVVTVEYHGNYGGYLHAAEHSVSLGEPRKEYLKIEKVCEDVFEAEVEALRAGATLAEVERKIRSPVRKAGMMYAECGIHGHGLSSPELATFVYGDVSECLYQEANSINEVVPFELKENMVFGMNIDISDPSWDRRAGLMLGDTLVVTKNGGRKLSRIPVELTVVPC